MISLRAATTVAITAAFSALALVGAIAAYVSTEHESNEFLDLQQSQIARYVGDLTFISPAEAALPPHDTEDDYVIEVTYGDGRPPKTSGSTTIIPDQSRTGFSEFENSVGHWRVFSLVTPGRTVQVAQQLVVRKELATDAAFRATLPFVLAVPLSWLVVSLVVGRLFQGLEGLAQEMGERDATDHTVVDIRAAPREVLPMVISFNQILTRLREVMTRQRNFLSDAAHELRTPLAALSIQIGNLARAGPNELEFNTRMGELQEGARRVSALTAQLLTIARYDSVDAERANEEVSLDELAKEVVSALLPLADEQMIDLGFSELQPVIINSSAVDIRTMLEILVANAVRYSPAGSEVDVSLSRDEQGICLTVLDDGPGVPEAALPRLTERFYRGTNPQTEGTGLGLAIAKAIAERRGIALHLSNRQGRPGFCAELRFSHIAADG